jgi:hypothetical protein
MKIKFSKSVDYVPEWNKNRELPLSEQIKSTIKPMEFDDLLTIMDAMGGQKAIDEAGGDTSKVKFDSGKFMQEAGNLFPKYVSLSNIEDADGPVNPADLLKYPVYAGLVVELLMKSSSISVPSDATEGNSEGQPG